MSRWLLALVPVLLSGCYEMHFRPGDEHPFAVLGPGADPAGGVAICYSVELPTRHGEEITLDLFPVDARNAPRWIVAGLRPAQLLAGAMIEEEVARERYGALYVAPVELRILNANLRGIPSADPSPSLRELHRVRGEIEGTLLTLGPAERHGVADGSSPPETLDEIYDLSFFVARHCDEWDADGIHR